MMFNPGIKTPIIILLILSIVFTVTKPGAADSGARKIQVVFVGIKLEDFPPDIKERILERVINLFASEPLLKLVRPGDIKEIVGAEKVANFFDKMDPESFSALAVELQADYVYAGRILNNKQASGRMLLVGELYRFDRSTNLRHKFEVLSYYEDFESRLIIFRKEFIKSVIEAESPGTPYLPYLIFAGIIAAAIAAFAFVKSDAGASGGSEPPPDPP